MKVACSRHMGFLRQLPIKLRVTVGESINVYAVHPGRMNTDMGRTTAQIEPEEAAIGFCNILEGTTHIEKDQWFIDYRGNAMPL